MTSRRDEHSVGPSACAAQRGTVTSLLARSLTMIVIEVLSFARERDDDESGRTDGRLRAGRPGGWAAVGRSDISCM
jgi:hypothetical protein